MPPRKFLRFRLFLKLLLVHSQVQFWLQLLYLLKYTIISNDHSIGYADRLCWIMGGKCWHHEHASCMQHRFMSVKCWNHEHVLHWIMSVKCWHHEHALFRPSLMLSLGMLVPNSRDWHKKWLANCSHFKTHLKININLTKANWMQFQYCSKIAVILNNTKFHIVEPAEKIKFQNPPVFCLPACLPATRPTSGGRIGLIFPHNTAYRLITKDLLFQLRFIHCTMVSLLILPCLPFSLTSEGKGEKSLKRCWWIVWLLLLIMSR